MVPAKKMTLGHHKDGKREAGEQERSPGKRQTSATQYRSSEPFEISVTGHHDTAMKCNLMPF